MTADPTLPTCTVHDDRETRLACPRCGRPACLTCLAEGRDHGGCRACGDATDRDTADRDTADRDAPVVVPRPSTRRSTAARAPVTFGLLAVVVAVFVFGSVVTGGDSSILRLGAQFNPAVRAGEWWRVLTATLLHANLTHLLFNGYALYVLGPQLERGVGSAAFGALYVASGLAGGLAFLASSPGQVAVGASGAIFGLFGAWFSAAWFNRDTPQGRAAFTQFGVLLAINLALPLFIPGIAWQAHVGGLAVGAVSGAVWALGSRRGVTWSARSRAAVPGGIVVALLVALLWYT